MLDRIFAPGARFAQYPLVLCVGCVCLLLTGAGPVSVDHWAGRKK